MSRAEEKGIRWPIPSRGAIRSSVIGVVAFQRSQYGPIAALQGIEAAAQAAGYLVNTHDAHLDDGGRDP